MSILDIFENPEYLERRDKFEKGLEAINQKYIHWFEQRPSLLEWEKHDSLGMHTTFLKNGNGIYFGFHEDSELPENIRQECRSLFKECFPES